MRTRVCGTCGKEFLITVPLKQYLYKTERDGHPTYYCGYTCWRKADGKLKHYKRIAS